MHACVHACTYVRSGARSGVGGQEPCTDEGHEDEGRGGPGADAHALEAQQQPGDEHHGEDARAHADGHHLVGMGLIGERTY